MALIYGGREKGFASGGSGSGGEVFEGRDAGRYMMTMMTVGVMSVVMVMMIMMRTDGD